MMRKIPLASVRPLLSLDLPLRPIFRRRSMCRRFRSLSERVPISALRLAMPGPPAAATSPDLIRLPVSLSRPTLAAVIRVE